MIFATGEWNFEYLFCIVNCCIVNKSRHKTIKKGVLSMESGYYYGTGE